MELLEQMGARLEETIKAYNELIEYYNSLDGLLEEMHNTLNQLDAKVDAEITNLQNQFNALKEANEQEIQQAIASLEKEIQGAIAEFTKQINDLIASVDDNNEQIKEEVQKQLDEFLANLPDVQNVLVTDPISGDVVTVTLALQHMYDYLTNQIQASLQMYSTKTGEIVPVSNMIQFNYGLLMESGAYTCKEWDNDNTCTCEQYDSMQATCFEQDWLSNSLYQQYETKGEN